MSVTLSSLLGHPEPLTADDIRDRRELAAGRPVSRHVVERDYGGLEDIGGAEFTVNICDVVVADLVSALAVTGVAVSDPTTGAAADQLAGVEADDTGAIAAEVRQYLLDCWQRSELSAASEGLFTAAAADGQAFVVVDYDGQGRPTAYVNAAYDGETGIEVKAVGPDGQLLVAEKHEIETLIRDKSSGLLVRVWDWFRSAVGLAVDRSRTEYVKRKLRHEYVYDPVSDTTRIRTFAVDPAKPERQVLMTPDGWETAPEGYAEVWEHGCPIVPVVAPGGGELAMLDSHQRLINHAALDLASAARTEGLRVLWSIDLSPLVSADDASAGSGYLADSGSYGEPGQPINLRRGAMLELVSMDSSRPGSIGHLPSADLTGLMSYLDQQIDAALQVARSSSLVRRSGDTAAVASGAALWLANRPFLSKVERYQERWGVSLRALYTLWQRMAGLAPLDAAPVWREVRTSSQAEGLQNAAAADLLGIPRRIIGTRYLQLSEVEVEEWLTEAERMDSARREAMLAQLALAGAATSVDVTEEGIGG